MWHAARVKPVSARCRVRACAGGCHRRGSGLGVTDTRASRAGCMSGVWKAPLTGSSCVFIAPAALASAATWRRTQHSVSSASLVLGEARRRCSHRLHDSCPRAGCNRRTGMIGGEHNIPIGKHDRCDGEPPHGSNRGSLGR